MASSIRLGKLFGIEIGINWSLVFVFALITWTVATEVLPIDVAGQGALAYWVAGVVGSIAFYACLLAHELAHALVARRYGVKVGGITLWLFGGLARLDGEPPSAGTEGLIAGVGPLTSLAVALIAFLLSLLPTPALVADLFLWLPFVNGALAPVHLISAFSLHCRPRLRSFFLLRSRG